MFKIENLSRIYHTKNDGIAGIQNFSMTLPDKGLVFVMGKSGSGKTTLMNVLAGLDDKTSGTVLLNDEIITDYSEKQWDHFRNKYMGIVFQSFNLIEDMNVYDNLALPLKILDTDSRVITQEVNRVLEYVSLSGYENRKIFELSAGQKQRIAIARAIIKSPDIILADEVTGNLDPNSSKQIFELLDKISKRCLVVIITHDKTAAYKYGDRIITIADGLLVSEEDNTKAKEIAVKKYHITLKDRVNQIEYNQDKQLDEFDIKSEILKSLEMNPNQTEINYSISFQLDNKEEAEDDGVLWKSNHNIKNLSFIEIMKLAVNNLTKRKTRLAITSILFLFTCTLFFITNIICNNDYIRSFSNYLEDKKITSMIPFRTETYIDNLKNEFETQVYKGKNFLQDISTVINKENIIKSLKEYDIGYTNAIGEEKFCITNFIINNNSEYFQNLEIEGRLPSRHNEILIDEKTADYFGITSNNLKETVTVYEDDFIVTGILYGTIQSDEYYSVLSQEFIQEKMRQEESIYFYANNLVLSASTRNYTSSATGIGAVSWIQAQGSSLKLIYGRLPSEKNEILISAELAEEAGWDGTDNFVTSYRLPDLYDEKYNNIYDDKMNMYDFMGKQVQVVGIYEGEQADETKNSNILIQDSVYKELKESYYELLYQDEYIINIDGYETYGTINALTDAGYKVNTDTSMYIYLFMDLTEKLGKGLNIAVLISMLMTIFMMMSYIVYNIRDHAKKIGILRAIGVGSKDITRMFLVETSAISCIAVSLSIGASALLVRIMNSKINQITRTVTLHMLTVNYSFILLLSVGIFIISVIMTMIPEIRFMHMKSIHLINDSLDEK